MNTKVKKVIGDLWINPGRTVLIITALVIGLWGVGSILVSYTILKHDLKVNFQRTDPPHVIIRSKDFDRLNLIDLRNRPEIEKAELRDFSTLRIETRPDEWIPLWLYGVEDFKNFNLARFYDYKGSGMPTVPNDGAMVIERDGLKFSDLKTGVNARIRSGGKVLKVPVDGIVFDPAQPPGTQDHLIYGYVNKRTFSAITGEAANQQLYVRFNNVVSREDVQVKTTNLVNYFKSINIAADKITIPNYNSHPHQWQLNTLLFLVGSIGLLAFVMGAVLVSQLMESILAKQIRQIGILKSIGASRSKILQIYIAMVLVMGVISGAIAIPLAIKFGYTYAYFVAHIINFEILTVHLPTQIYVYLIAASLLLPVIFSLPAILKGTAISVRDALSDYGIQQEKSTRKARIIHSWIPGNLAMAIRNSLRRKKRFLVTVASMALGVAIFNTGFNVQQSIKNLLSDVNKSMKHDIQVALISPIPKVDALKYFAGIGNISRIEAWNGGRGVMQSMVIATDEGVGIISLPYNTDLVGFRSIKGKWLNSSTEPQIVLNQEAEILYNHPVVGTWQTISIKGKALKAKLVGIVNEAEKPKIYMDEHLYDSVVNPNHYVNNLMFVAKDRSYNKVLALKRDIEKAITPTNMQILYVMAQAERLKIIYDHLLIILVTIIFFASLVLVVSAIGMASTTSINIMERTREIGVLRAIGATPKLIYNLFVTEGMILSIVSIVLGLLISWPLSIIATRFFGKLMLDIVLQPALNINGLLITLAVTFIFGWLSSRIPGQRAVSVSTSKALMYE
ncbi:MAG: FtsX-like permease family protein [Bacillota bacterium]|nr:FtsX-like permease family protein [Bacillota bacterium]